MLVNCADDVLGPLKTDHTPLPTAGLFPERVAAFPRQIVCVELFVAAVGEATTLTVPVTGFPEQVSPPETFWGVTVTV